MSPDPAETRAEVARRRLAELVSSFESRMPVADATPDPDDPPVATRRRIRPGHVRAVVVLGVAAAVLVGWNLLSGRPGSAPADGSLAFAGAPASPEASADGGSPAGVDGGQELVVDVVGHVHRPGIVTLPAGSRVHEAIAAAGGVAGQVDTTALNMARVLTDGEQIAVGIAPVAPAGAAAPGGATGGLVNLNTATEEQLDALPGVGPVTAASILAWRTENGRFSSVEDLLEVRGIGEATLAELRDLVTV